MILFPEIEKKETKKNVQELLSTYSSLVRIVGKDYIPKITATYSFELNKEDSGVSFEVEHYFDRKKAAEIQLVKIIHGLNRLDSHDRQLLYDKYINCEMPTNISIYMKHHMSESKFYREMNRALLRFAESYENGELLVEK